MTLWTWVAMALLVFAHGCAVQKTWIPVDGSRADGTVTLGYEYERNQIPLVDEERGSVLAVKRCQAWGYEKALPFGGNVTSCIDVYCRMVQARVTYQCLGTLNP